MKGVNEMKVSKVNEIQSELNAMKSILPALDVQATENNIAIINALDGSIKFITNILEESKKDKGDTPDGNAETE